MPHLWVALAGPAGAGKSSLSRAAGAFLRHSRIAVDVCGEHELCARREFKQVATALRAPRAPTREELEAAYAAWLPGLPPNAVVVTDWHPAHPR